MSSNIKFLPINERTLLIQFEKNISKDTHKKVFNYVESLKKEKISGIEDIVPAFSSIALNYDPRIISYKSLVERLESINFSSINKKKRKLLHIPVVYGNQYGEDLKKVAEQKEISEEEVIKEHVSKNYLIYLLGFISGYPYCGNISDKISLPRKKTPVLKVKKGTVAIANNQTIIYPMESPGGWHNIGFTPLNTFNPHSEEPSIFYPGDYVKFEKISEEEAESWDKYSEKRWWEKWGE